MLRNERTRLLLSLVLAMLLAVLSTLCVTAWAFVDARRELTRQNQSGLALAAIELRQRSGLDTGDILRVLSSSSQRIAFAREDQVSPEAASQARGGQVAFDAGQWQTVFMLDGQMCVVSQANTGLVPRMLAFYLLATAAAFSVLTLIVGRFTAGRLVRPVAALSDAAKRIAEGDFTVRVPQERYMSEQVRGLIGDFNAMAQALSGVEYLRRDFTSSVSHEIKTPVAAIHSYAQLMQLPGVDAQTQRGYAQAIARESRRLSGLSDSLLRLSRLESEGASANTARYRIGEQLREIAASLLPAMEDKHITLTADIPDAAAVADEELMAQAFLNILGNAVKFTPEGGGISVVMRRTPQLLTVTVSDTGCGMDEETMAHIFEKFYQGDKSHATQGVGLGLALVRRIVQLHGGEMKVSSEVGKGSAFTIELPQRA